MQDIKNDANSVLATSLVRADAADGTDYDAGHDASYDVNYDAVYEEAKASGQLAAIAQLTEEAREYVKKSRAANTIRAYKSDWQDFCGWCETHRYTTLPAAPEAVALYLTFLARDLKPSTIKRRMVAITQAHKTAGFTDSPVRDAAVRSVWLGIRRDKRMVTDGKSPTLTADLRLMVEHLPDGKLLSTRDRALLLLGFAGAMRRSELVGLDVADVVDTEDGLIVTIRQSKTDQEGVGRKIGIPYGSHPQTCPVRSLRAWLKASAIEDGAIFRGMNRHGQVSPMRLTDQSVAKVVKRSLEAAGRNADAFAGHSLRAGLATQAAISGASERSIQDQTGHKSLVMLRRYIRDGSLFRENAAAKVGL